MSNIIKYSNYTETKLSDNSFKREYHIKTKEIYEMFPGDVAYFEIPTNGKAQFHRLDGPSVTRGTFKEWQLHGDIIFWKLNNGTFGFDELVNVSEEKMFIFKNIYLLNKD